MIWSGSFALDSCIKTRKNNHKTFGLSDKLHAKPLLAFVNYSAKLTLMIHHAEGYYGVQDYAKLCGVSPRNIRDRIRARSIHHVKKDSFYFINAILSPPVRRINPAKPARSKETSTPHFSFDGLREVGFFARGKHFSEGIIYEAILTGKLDGYVIGDKVFIKPPEAEEFYKNR